MSSNIAIGLVIGSSVAGAVLGVNKVTKAIEKLKGSSLTAGERVAAFSKLSVASMGAAVGSATALGTSVMALSQPAIAFESAMADVRKVVDFKSPEGFKNLSKDILELTRTLPMSAEELAAITASGGQLGVAEQDLKAFTTTIAKMSVAFDMSAEESGDAMAKLANVYKIPISEIGQLGDAINELSNSSPAKASDIVSTLGRIGGVAKQFGLTQNAAAALSNSFISLGKAPEVAGTAINGMLTKLMTADKGGKKFQAALKKVGLSSKGLKKAIEKDAQGALVDFLKTLEKVPKSQQMGVLVDLFGLEYADDVAVLAGNVGVLENSLKTLQTTDANGKASYLGSMEKEFAARSATTENNLQLLKNSLSELAVTIGSKLLPIINKVVNNLKPVITSIVDWMGRNESLTETLVSVGLGVTAIVPGALFLFSALSAGRVALNVFRLTLGTLGKTGEDTGKRFELISKIITKSSALMKSGVIAAWRGITKIVRVSATGVLKLAKLMATGTIRIVQLMTAGITKTIGLVVSGLAKGALLVAKAVSGLAGMAVRFAGLMATGIAKGAGLLAKALLGAGKAVLFLGRALLMNPIGLAITAIALGAYLIYRYWEPIKGFFINLWNSISQRFAQASAWLQSVWTSVTTWFSTQWETLKTSFSSGIQAVTGFISQFNPVAAFESAWSAVSEWVTNAWTSVTSFFSQGVTNLSAAISQWNPLTLFMQAMSGVLSYFGIDLPASFSGFGKNIIDGLVSGISNAWSAAKEKVAELGAGVKKWFADKLGIKSPSRVFMGYGRNTVDGLVIGLNKAMPQANAASQQLADTVSITPTAKIGVVLDNQPAKRLIDDKQVTSRVVENHLVTKELVENQQITKRLVEDKLVTNKLVENQLVTKELVENKQVSQNLTENQQVTKRLVEDKLVTNKFVENQLVTKELVENKQVSQNLTENQQVTKRLVEDKLVTNKFVENQLVTKELVENKQVSQNLTENQQVTKRLVEDKLVTNKFIENQQFTKNIVANELVNKQITEQEYQQTANERPTRQNAQRQSYQPLFATEAPAQQPLPQPSITVDFNPTINITAGASSGNVMNQVQEGLKMSLHEFERLLERVMDQKMRRAY